MKIKEKNEEECQLIRLKGIQRKIKETTCVNRMRLITVINNLQKMSEYLSEIKVTLSFDEKLDIAYQDLDNIYLDESQKMMLRDISKEATAIVPLHDFIIRGFILRAIKHWQLTYQQPIMIFTQLNRFKRFKAGVEILSKAKDGISKAFYIPNKKVKHLLICEMFQVMIERYEELLSIQSLINNSDIQDYFINYEDTSVDIL